MILFWQFSLAHPVCFTGSKKEPFLLYKCSFKGINQARCFSVFIVELSMFLTTG